MTNRECVRARAESSPDGRVRRSQAPACGPERDARGETAQGELGRNRDALMSSGTETLPSVPELGGDVRLTARLRTPAPRPFDPARVCGALLALAITAAAWAGILWAVGVL